MIQNWKTSLAGLAAVLTAVADIVHSLSAGQPINWNVDIPAVVGGVGLIAAKDATTHSTQSEVTKATVETGASSVK